jgi:hypothetical protein
MRNRHLTYGLIWAAICWPLDAYAAPAFLPDCAGKVEIAHARVTRVEQNGALILSDGRAVLLEGIRLALDGDARERVLSVLRDMVKAEPVTFTATPPKEDRYDRVRAQAFGHSWLQIALLEQGLARVAISPDRNECAPDLYEAEARGREGHLGIWALIGYQAKAPEAVKGSAGTFQLVDGWVTNVGQADGRVFIDFGSNGRQLFSAVIQRQDRRAFRDFDFDELPAHHIRIRGIVQDYHGRPEILLSNPAQIEVLQ